MNIKKKFLKLTSKTYPHGTELQLKDHLPNGYKEDGFGNFYIEIGSNSTTMFTCHLDTADRKQEKVRHIFDGDFIKTDGKTILGADDKAGMTILLYMIENKIPGLYYFFVGEERGCVGSKKLSNNWDKSHFSNYITKCVSFDRRGLDSVITEQFYGVCCSTEFAKELSNRLNAVEMTFNYSPDPTGIYTDSAQFTELIPECTNISVGYYNEHSCSEKQNIKHLEKLCQAVCKIDWESLPIIRNPKDESYSYEEFDYDFSYAKTEGWNIENFSYFSSGTSSVTKMFISDSQIEKEKSIISNWILNSGFCPGFKDIIWNGNSLHVANSVGNYEYLGDRMDLLDMIPELSEVPITHVSSKFPD